MNEYKKKQSKDAMLSIKNIGDRVNVDAAKNVAANDCEEALLGMMMVFDENRRRAATGHTELRADDFVTAFGRRVFEVLCELENSEQGYSRALLGQYFGVDEIARLEKIEIERRRLSKNDEEAFDVSVANLKRQKAQGADMHGQDLLELARKNRKK